MIEITVQSINTKRELFPNLLNAPAFYERYFRPWVQSALEERTALDKFHAGALEKLGIKK